MDTLLEFASCVPIVNKRADSLVLPLFLRLKTGAGRTKVKKGIIRETLSLRDSVTSCAVGLHAHLPPARPYSEIARAVRDVERL